MPTCCAPILLVSHRLMRRSLPQLPSTVGCFGLHATWCSTAHHTQLSRQLQPLCPLYSFTNAAK